MFRAFSLILLTSLPIFAGDLTGKYEVLAFGGVTNRVPTGSGADGTFGGNFGYGLTSKTVLFGEVASSAGGYDYVDVHGGLRQTLLTRGRLEPYVLGGIGMAHATSLFSIAGSSSTNSLSVNAGFGARIYLSPRWGVQPEFRWMHFFQGDRNDPDLLRFTGGIFFQWGWR
jgi:hypothetical protein